MPTRVRKKRAKNVAEYLTRRDRMFGDRSADVCFLARPDMDCFLS